MTKVVDEKNLIKDFRLLCGLQNKNSELYSELLLAINNLIKGYINIVLQILYLVKYQIKQILAYVNVLK